MRLPDTNVLVHAVNLDSPQQATAERWLAEAFDGSGGVALSWTALFGFLRIATRPGILTNDAHLAALAIEHGATLGSFDRDFQRFAGLQFELLRA